MLPDSNGSTAVRSAQWTCRTAGQVSGGNTQDQVPAITNQERAQLLQHLLQDVSTRARKMPMTPILRPNYIPGAAAHTIRFNKTVSIQVNTYVHVACPRLTTNYNATFLV